MIRKILLALSLALLTVCAHGSTFNLFSPATGILKGSASTYVTSAAVSTDISGLWSGTCDDTTYLRGDGTCATPPGAGGGTVNSVGLTAPSVFSVAGSPVTNTGTLALTFATGQTQNRVLASPDGSSGAIALRALVLDDLPTIPLTSKVSGTLPVANGGIGAATLTGIAKGNGTSAFSVADSSDVIGLWTGTCSSGTFLRGDGSCQMAGTGSVTSVAMTVPSGFSVTGSPITTSGTLAVTGTLNPAAGGTGVATLTGIAKGNGTSAFSVAGSSDVIGTFTGLCSSSTYLRGDGSCQTPAGSVTGANPTATIGLTTVNGSSGSFLRADGAPALSQSIVPTWTGTHTFNASNAQAVWQNASATTNAKNWLQRVTTAGDFAISTASDAAPTTAVQNAIEIGRSGSSMVIMNFGNATGNPTYNFLGSGLATFSGAATFSGLITTARSADEQLRIGGTATNPFVSLYNGSSTRVGYVQYTNATTGIEIVNETAAGNLNLTTSGSGVVRANGSRVCTANGAGCPVKTAYAQMFNNGTCNIGAHSVTAVGFASCSQTATGRVTGTFSASYFSAPPACTMTASAASAQVTAQLGTVTASAVTALTYRNLAGVPTDIDADVYIICTGPG